MLHFAFFLLSSLFSWNTYEVILKRLPVILNTLHLSNKMEKNNIWSHTLTL